MSNPLRSAIEQGWTSKSPGEDGIIECLDPLDREISYPKKMYEQINKETETDTGNWVMHRAREIFGELKVIDLDELLVNKIINTYFSLESIFSRGIPLPYGWTVLAVYKKNSF